MWLLCCIRITIKKSVNTPESEEQLINLRKGTIRGACERRVSLFHEEEKICAVSPGGMWMCTELLKTPKAETRTATATARFSTVEETVSVFEYFSTTERDWEHGSFHINSKQVLSKQYVHTGEVTSNKRTQLCECEAVFFFFFFFPRVWMDSSCSTRQNAKVTMKLREQVIRSGETASGSS